MCIKISLFLVSIFLLINQLPSFLNVLQNFHGLTSIECSKDRPVPQKMKNNMENKNIVIQIQRTHVSYFAGTEITKEPKIFITKGGTWSRIEDDIPLEKKITQDGALKITELKKTRRVTQKKLSQNQMEKLYSLMYKINNFEAVISLNALYPMDDGDSYTSLSINYNDGRPVVNVNISNFIHFDDMSPKEYYYAHRHSAKEDVIQYEIVMSNWKAYIELVEYIYSL